MKTPLVIGLTGGIATGKTTVSSMWAEWGASVIDADALARQAVAPGSDGLAEVVEAFGPEVLSPDGSLDRKAMAERIFRDADQRRRLEAIIHPRVVASYEERIRAVEEAGAPRIVILSVPLLFETGAALHLTDRTVVVRADPDVQLRRLMARDALDEEEARRRIATQMPLPEKERRADYVIDNSGSLEETRKQAAALWEEWKRLADRAGGP